METQVKELLSGKSRNHLEPGLRNDLVSIPSAPGPFQAHCRSVTETVNKTLLTKLQSCPGFRLAPFRPSQHFQHSGLFLTLGSQRPKVGGVIFSLSIKHNSGPAVSSSQSETKSLCWFEGKWNHCVLLPFVINIVNEGIFCLRQHNPFQSTPICQPWSIREKASLTDLVKHLTGH